jgi:hypothetical protein
VHLSLSASLVSRALTLLRFPDHKKEFQVCLSRGHSSAIRAAHLLSSSRPFERASSIRLPSSLRSSREFLSSPAPTSFVGPSLNGHLEQMASRRQRTLVIRTPPHASLTDDLKSTRWRGRSSSSPVSFQSLELDLNGFTDTHSQLSNTTARSGCSSHIGCSIGQASSRRSRSTRRLQRSLARLRILPRSTRPTLSRRRISTSSSARPRMHSLPSSSMATARKRESSLASS